MGHFYLRKRLFAFLFISFLVLTAIKAQDDCATTLSKAQKLYDAGVIEQIPQMLQQCLNKGFTDEEKLQANKLIIMSYLFDNNSIKADNAMLDFLKKYPEYELVQSDPAEFVQLFKTYRTFPIASIGIIAGTNISQVYATHIYTDLVKGKYSSSGFSYQVGMAFKRYIINNLDLSLEAIYGISSYKYTATTTAQNYVDFKEELSYIDLPITAVYTPFTFRIINPYLRGGFDVSYLLSSSATYNLTPPDANKPLTEPSSDITEFRAPLQLRAILGTGININLKNGNLFVDFRYNKGLNRYNNPDKRLGSVQYPYSQENYFYTDNNLNYSNIWISIGYFYKFYKPEKKLN